MDVYMSEKEQLQLIKEWWKKNGTAVLLGLLIVVAGSFGWRYWQQYKLQHAQQASIVYEEMLSAKAANKADDFQLFAKHLKNDYKSTPYASMAAMFLAQNAVSVNNYDLAAQNLAWAVKNGSSDNLQQIARIREARVLLAQKKYTDALALLKKVDDDAYLSAIAETKGDIYFAMGNKNQALQAYLYAQKQLTKKSVRMPMLKMKINQLKRS